MPDSDEQLVRRAQVRDHAAFGELVARHQQKIRNWLAHLCGDRTRADDLAQNTFIRAWERIRSLQEAAKFSPWLMRIAYNEFLKSHRAAGRRLRMTKRFARHQDVLGGGGETRADDISRLELERALALLSEQERAVVVLNYAYGYSHREVSKLTDLPIGTVKSLIHRGSRKVRKHA